MNRCARCGGGLMRSWGDLVCLACGHEPYALTPELEALLRAEQGRAADKSRKRVPVYMGIKLD